MESILSQYHYSNKLNNINDEIESLKKSSEKYIADADALQTMFNSIDLTTLRASDSTDSVRAFVEKVNSFAKDYPNLKNVGGICVYSVFAPVLKSVLKVEGVHKAVVSACFPSSQTFTDIKCAEVSKAVNMGADEVDVVISVGEFLEGNYDFVAQEITKIKEACNGARLKVILETGALQNNQNIWTASVIDMESGADIIKTSTGKNCDGATPEAAYVMCSAIKAYVEKRGRKVGFKPAGGIRTTSDAALYYTIVRTLLGKEWTDDNTLFRIGASGLANALLKDITALTGGKQVDKYF